MEQKTKQVKTKKRRITQILSAFFGALIIGGAAIVNITRTGYAADVSGFSVSNLTASYEKGTWSSSNNNNLTGTIEATATSGCSGTTYSQQTSTLTITNSSPSLAGTISFTYKLSNNGGSAKIGSKSISANEEGTVSSDSIPAAGSYSITHTSAKAAGVSTLTITGITFQLESAMFSTTFTAGEHGSYVVSSSTLEATTISGTTEVSHQQDTSDPYTFVVTPSEGYQLAGWYYGSTFVEDSSLNSTWQASANNLIVKPRFIPYGSATFQVGSIKYFDLNEADAAAKKLSNNKNIILVKDGLVGAGNYTISSGVTLLIPYNSAYTIVTDSNIDDSNMATEATTRSEFSRLTMKAGSNITVYGSISVASQVNKSSQGQAGPYGLIVMEENSKITLKNGSKLYAFGYVTGTGTIDTESGASVFENMFIADYPGSASTTASICEDVFPFSKFTVRNIEANLVVGSGVTEKLLANIYGTLAGYNVLWVPLFGTGSMFTPSGTMTKSYVGGRQIFTVEGDLSINPVSVTKYITIDTSKGLPIPYNYTLNVNSGTTTCNENIIFCKGSRINVSQNASINISSGKNVYLMDSQDDAEAGGTTDATLDLNGAINVSGGFYTSTNGATIKTSEKTGVVNFLTAAKDATTVKKKTAKATVGTINVTSAQLTNGDGSFTKTEGATSGESFYYCEDCESTGVWETEHSIADNTITFKSQDGTQTLDTQTIRTNQPVVYDGETPTKAATDQYNYTFVGWAESANQETGTPIGELPAVTQDKTYYAAFSKTTRKYTITFLDDDETTVLQSSQFDYGTMPICETPASKPYDEHSSYVFDGWSPSVVTVAGDATYIATYKLAYNPYAIRFEDEDHTELQTKDVPYGDVPTYDYGTPTKEGDAQYSYTFQGWSDGTNTYVGELPAVTGPTTYTAVYSQSTNSYTIRFVNEDGTELQSSSYDYGDTPVYSGATPAKAADGQYTYTFSGWSPTITTVTGDATYTAQYSTSIISYTVTWVDWDNTVLDTDMVEYGVIPTYQGAKPTRETIGRTHYEFSGWGNVVAVTGNVTYKAQYREYVNGIYEENGTSTFYDTNGNPIDGGLLGAVVYYGNSGDAIYDAPDGHYYYVDQNGVVLQHAGLVAEKVGTDFVYYYFGENNFAYTSGRFYCDMTIKTGVAQQENIGGAFASGWYTFDSTGKIIRGAPSSIVNGIAKDALGNVCEGYGLFQLSDGHYYYATEDGSIVKNGTFYVERTNDLKYNGEDVEAGLYYFDANGYMHTIVDGSLTTMMEVQA